MTTLPGPLVDATWLAEHVEDVRVVDTRWYLRPTDGRTGAQAYAEGHLPGAVFLDVDTDLAAPATAADGRHPLPSPEHFAAALGRAGIASGVPVVVYDDAGGSIAARLWWLLRVLGEPAAVLDGGWASWGGPLTTHLPHIDPVARAPQPWPPEFFRTADELDDAILLDARTAQRYAHGDPEIDPRPGHIPGAHSAPWAANLDASGRFLPPAELRSHYAALGVDGSSAPVVAYCGSGVTACHDLLALAVAGVTDVALYPGSWSQWGNDASRPAESG